MCYKVALSSASSALADRMFEGSLAGGYDERYAALELARGIRSGAPGIDDQVDIDPFNNFDKSADAPQNNNIHARTQLLHVIAMQQFGHVFDASQDFMFPRISRSVSACLVCKCANFSCVNLKRFNLQNSLHVMQLLSDQRK